jgi:hypothetical protein
MQAARAVWRFISGNPVLSAAGNVITLAPFAVGAGVFVWGVMKGVNPLIVAGVVLFAANVVLLAWPKVRRGHHQPPSLGPAERREQRAPHEGEGQSRPGDLLLRHTREREAHGPPVPSAQPPELSLGKAQMPRQPQQMIIDPDAHPIMHPKGRVVQVPITNAQGAATAESVQVLLHFRPDDVQGSYSPRDPVLAEWDTDPITTRIDIPGNGQPHLVNVALVLDAVHPCIFQWTRHSREAKLHGYAIVGRGVVRVEVRGAGRGDSAPSITDTLHIEAVEGSLCAQWESEGLGTRSNCVPWRSPPLLGPPPGTRAS